MVFISNTVEEWIRNASIFMAISVSDNGYREIIGVAKYMKEDKKSRRSFFVWLKKQGFTGACFTIANKMHGMPEHTYCKCS